MAPPKLKKRSHSVEPEDDEVSNKDLLVAISALTNRVTAFESSLTNMVDEKVAALEKNIMEQVNEYKQGTSVRVGRIEKRMEDFEQQTTINLNAANDEHVKLISEEIDSKLAASLTNGNSNVLESRIDQLERQLRMNELVISGVPYLDNEKVIDIVSSICGVIKFAGGRDVFESCFRLPIRNIRRRSTPSIIVKFWAVEAKTDFFRCYFNANKLCTSMVGYSSASRIYINENLTKRNFEIFCSARDLKKEGKIVRYSTQRGRVVVKIQGSERSFTIDTLDQLSSLVNRTAAASNMDN